MTTVYEAISAVYLGNSLMQYLIFFGCIIAGIIAGKILYYLFKNQIRKITQKSATQLDDYFVDIIEEPIVLLVVTIGFWSGQKFLTLSPPIETFFNNVTFILVTLTVSWSILRVIDMLIKRYLEPLAAKSESKLDDQILPIIRKSAKAMIIVLTVIIVLSNLGYDILSLLAGLGIGGLAIALAAQDTVKNIIGGITIFWDKPFQIDDFVEVSNEMGTVSEVGLRSTRLRTINGTMVVIPNSKVADAVIENYAARTSRRMSLTIGLTYDTSHEQMENAIQIIRDTITAIHGINHDDIIIRFVNFGAYALDLEIIYWITDMANWRMIIHQVNIGLKRHLDQAGIEMAFPTATHYVINSSPNAAQPASPSVNRQKTRK